MRGESRTALERDELSVLDSVEATRHISSLFTLCVGSFSTVNVLSAGSSSSTDTIIEDSSSSLLAKVSGWATSIILLRRDEINGIVLDDWWD